jgi:hypothetical protein
MNQQWGDCPICGRRVGMYEVHDCRRVWTGPVTTGTSSVTIQQSEHARLTEAVIVAVRHALPWLLKLADLLGGENAPGETRRAWARVYAIRDALSALGEGAR